MTIEIAIINETDAELAGFLTQRNAFQVHPAQHLATRPTDVHVLPRSTRLVGLFHHGNSVAGPSQPESRGRTGDTGPRSRSANGYARCMPTVTRAMTVAAQCHQIPEGQRCTRSDAGSVGVGASWHNLSVTNFVFEKLTGNTEKQLTEVRDRLDRE